MHPSTSKRTSFKRAKERGKIIFQTYDDSRDVGWMVMMMILHSSYSYLVAWWLLVWCNKSSEWKPTSDTHTRIAENVEMSHFTAPAISFDLFPSYYTYEPWKKHTRVNDIPFSYGFSSLCQSKNVFLFCNLSLSLSLSSTRLLAGTFSSCIFLHEVVACMRIWSFPATTKIAYKQHFTLNSHIFPRRHERKA